MNAPDFFPCILGPPIPQVKIIGEQNPGFSLIDPTVDPPDTSTWSEGPRMPGPYGIDNTSGTIGNGVFYVMGGNVGGGSLVSVSYSIPLSDLNVPHR
jgi:hypothetical protein